MHLALKFSLLSTFLIISGSLYRLQVPGGSAVSDGLLTAGLCTLVVAVITLGYGEFNHNETG